jgi:ribose transport system substrate-binding protein
MRLWLVFGAVLAVTSCQGATTTAVGPSASSAAVESAMPTGDVLAEAKLAVNQGNATDQWSGPATGVKRAAEHGQVYFVAADLKNGGIAALWEGVSAAATAMGWTAVKRDGAGSPEVRAEALQAAINARPLAIIVGGFDPTEHPDLVQAAKAESVVVGWHAGSAPGPDPAGMLFTNISTQPADVAMLAADFVIVHSNGHAGVAIFTDSQYQIALDKANIMKAQIQRCLTCQVLAYRDSPIADATRLMPTVVHDLRTEFNSSLTYLLAINGNYFAGTMLGLKADGVPGSAAPFAVAAGDGDQAEFARIRDGNYQLASVAEPLYLQGWQLIDEINRALAHQPPSGWTPKPGLITADTIRGQGDVWDPDSAYQANYRRLWGVTP